MQKLSSLSIFFPFLNDEKTVSNQIQSAYKIGEKLAKDIEVIAIHGGPSKDKTFEKIKKMKNIYPSLIVIDKSYNQEGYAVIKQGFWLATKDWVFYTDGDAQYKLSELKLLIEKQFETGADIVNGYKKERGDSFVRKLLGEGYRIFAKMLFQLPISDVDCDFRLIRNSFLKKILLESKDASILPELIVKLKMLGASFAEVHVTHRPRSYGKSNYNPFQLTTEKIGGDIKLWVKIKCGI